MLKLDINNVTNTDIQQALDDYVPDGGNRFEEAKQLASFNNLLLQDSLFNMTLATVALFAKANNKPQVLVSFLVSYGFTLAQTHANRREIDEVHRESGEGASLNSSGL